MSDTRETVTYRVEHKTDLSYATPVAQARFNIRLKPYAWPGQEISEQQLVLTPSPPARWTRMGLT